MVFLSHELVKIIKERSVLKLGLLGMFDHLCNISSLHLIYVVW